MYIPIVVVSFSPINSDSRVLRQIKSLSSHYSVHSIGYSDSPEFVSSHLKIKSDRSIFHRLIGAFLLLTRKYSLFYDFWFYRQLVVSHIFQLGARAVVLNDVSSWPIASYLSPNICVLDAHEFSPQELSDRLLWTILFGPFKHWCSKFAYLGSIRFSVEPYLCLLWEQYSGCKFHLLPNSSYYVSPFQYTTSLSPVIRVIHHGLAHPSRRIELMISAIDQAGDHFKGFFYLTGSDKIYINQLSELSGNLNSVVLPPMPHMDLIPRGSLFDVALLSIYPSNPNYSNCLPNKLYQFIQSRLPIVCGPTPSIARIVRDYKIGVVADDFSAAALATALQTLTPQVLIEMRSNLEIAARELCWDIDQQTFIDAVNLVVAPSNIN